MVAKIKSSFLKNSFQLFCYKNVLSKTDSSPTSSLTTNFDYDNNTSNNNTRSFKSYHHSTSSPSLNEKPEDLHLQNIYDNTKQVLNSKNLNSNHYVHNGSSKNRKHDHTNKSMEHNPKSSSSNDKASYYYNNRKHLSKLLQSKGKLNNNINGAHKNKHIPPSNSELIVLSDLEENTELINRKKRSKSSNAIITSSNSTTPKPKKDLSEKLNNNDSASNNSNSPNEPKKHILNDLNRSGYKPNNNNSTNGNQYVSSQNRHSYPNNNTSETCEYNDAFVYDTDSNNNLKISFLKMEQSNESSNSSLYRNQSIATLKLAKKIQQMNKTNANPNPQPAINTNNVNSSTNSKTADSEISKSGTLNTILKQSNGLNRNNSAKLFSSSHFHKASKIFKGSNNEPNRRSFSASNAKKVVRFADALGLELESTITLNQMDYIPIRRLKQNGANTTPNSFSNYNVYQNSFNYNGNFNNNNNNNFSEFIEKDFYKNKDYDDLLNKILIGSLNNTNSENKLINDYENSPVEVNNSSREKTSFKNSVNVQSYFNLLDENSNNKNINDVNTLSNNLNQIKIRNSNANNINTINITSSSSSDQESNSSDSTNSNRLINHFYINNNNNSSSQRLSNSNNGSIKIINRQPNINNVNISNSNNNAQNIKITTRINNGKLESEV
jgi:hypothetical protein